MQNKMTKARQYRQSASLTPGIMALAISLALCSPEMFAASTSLPQPLQQDHVQHQWVPKSAEQPALINAPIDPKPQHLQRPVTDEESFFQAHSKTQQLQAAQALVTAECASAVLGYGSYSGQALVDHILATPNNCINDLFNGEPNSIAAFSASKMAFVANATAGLASSYNGSGSDVTLGKLYYYLRAGYYVQYYNNTQIPTYPAAVKTAVRAALDNLFSNPAFYQNSALNGQNIQDALTLVDSAGENVRYLYVVKEWLQRWNSSYASDWYMRGAVNQIFTILYRGHQDSAFVTATSNDTVLIARLGNFARQNWMIGTEASFLQENAAAELARFLQYPNAAIANDVKSHVTAILNQYSMTGTGSAVWLRVASAVDYYGQCATYNICGFADQLEQQILSQQHSCSDSMKFRAQHMSAAEFTDSCNAVSAQESFFHNFLRTNQQPVADDLNSNLEMVVFDSSADYGQYAGLFFGIDTNNGGMYLEGNPASASNQARFIAYEAEWLRPEFHVWNLTHEMVHYLDGRFNLKGDFGASKVDTHKTVWWIEGLAEYVSKKNRNDTAITMARTKQFTLSEILKNNYSSGQDRVYRWGYLAVRFMFETQPAKVSNFLSYFREGDYDGYLTAVNAIGTSLDSQWLTWLGTVQSNDSIPQVTIGETGNGAALTNGQTKTGLSANQGQWLQYYIDVPANQEKLVVVQSGGTGDADLYLNPGSQPSSQNYSCRPYVGGNSESCTMNNPVAGRWYIGSYAYANFSNVGLTATYTPRPTQPDACATQSPVDYVAVQAGQMYCVVAGNDNYTYFYYYNNTANARLKLSLYGPATGNADLYFSASSWPTSSSYQQRSENTDSTEQILTNPLAVGWSYIAVKGNPSRGQTTLVVSVQ
ncbi:MAG: M9 family metallopeptidase [Gammaproteobacteria bacterium]|nr:M9 family metallopeptidase [Gammaproteobacteria bacterium]MBU2179676.1 M9 family metallopeptidase [Gammaproteobacteria bacterium]MBU2224554.1 M9 family metallopeptidase [Gammaproteobacteria bacterium]MBU2280265.1 M9 family metallopeptidase [Gammaproteobacteria bacterium]MBU2425473.1 M9 family metallopeptidase [Gammaproteobacteria bacterium]